MVGANLLKERPLMLAASRLAFSRNSVLVGHNTDDSKQSVRLQLNGHDRDARSRQHNMLAPHPVACVKPVRAVACLGIWCVALGILGQAKLASVSQQCCPKAPNAFWRPQTRASNDCF